jgi:hypothetical protein
MVSLPNHANTEKEIGAELDEAQVTLSVGSSYLSFQSALCLKMLAIKKSLKFFYFRDF